VLTCARLALADIFSPAFRTVMLKSLGLTLLLLAGLWLGLTLLVSWAIDLGAYPWLDTLVNLLAGLALFVGLAFLVMPVAALFAGLYSDEVAGAVERVHYSFDPPGRDLPVGEAAGDAIGFAVVALVVNAIALLLLLVPVVNLVAFLAGNGYLLGREFFNATARRYVSRAEANAARRAHSGKVFLGGLLIAALGAIPLVNLLMPLFAIAFMVHLYKRTIRPVPPQWTDFAG
jgi:CysZ protein